ncbi:Lipooligosaccharide biosynthesis protein lex-1, partial [Haemophilus influenzae]
IFIKKKGILTHFIIKKKILLNYYLLFHKIKVKAISILWNMI